jgi:hypothetical protein
MTFRSRIALWIGRAVFSAALCCTLSAQIHPATVQKIEPPNWQMGPSSNLMLCLAGQHLDSVVGVAVRHKGVRVIRIKSPDENHLFVLLRIASDAVPGTMMLQVSTRFMTTFATVPMFEQNAAVASRGTLTGDK